MENIYTIYEQKQEFDNFFNDLLKNNKTISSDDFYEKMSNFFKNKKYSQEIGKYIWTMIATNENTIDAAQLYNLFIDLNSIVIKSKISTFNYHILSELIDNNEKRLFDLIDLNKGIFIKKEKINLINLIWKTNLLNKPKIIEKMLETNENKQEFSHCFGYYIALFNNEKRLNWELNFVIDSVESLSYIFEKLQKEDLNVNEEIFNLLKENKSQQILLLKQKMINDYEQIDFNEEKLDKFFTFIEKKHLDKNFNIENIKDKLIDLKNYFNSNDKDKIKVIILEKFLLNIEIKKEIKMTENKNIVKI